MARGGFWQLTWCSGGKAFHDQQYCPRPVAWNPAWVLRQALAVGWMSQKQQALTTGRLTMECAIYLGFQHRCKHPEGSCSHQDLKKKKAPSDPETDIFPLLQMILESKVHFSPQMPRIRAEATRTTAVTLHDKCQLKLWQMWRGIYTSFLIIIPRPIHFLTK